MLDIDTSGIDSFCSWLDEQTVRIPLEVRIAFRSWAVHIHASITELSPQWSGNLAANWMLDIGSPSSSANYYMGPAGDQPFSEGTRGAPTYSRGMEPAVGISKARAKAVGIPGLGQSLFIHNPVAYSDSIENDTSDPPVRPVNRLPRSETGKVAMVYHAYTKFSEMKDLPP